MKGKKLIFSDLSILIETKFMTAATTTEKAATSAPPAKTTTSAATATTTTTTTTTTRTRKSLRSERLSLNRLNLTAYPTRVK